MEEFDQEIFNALVDYIIIGGCDENEVKETYIIRFILKRKLDLRVLNEIPKEINSQEQ